MEEERTDGGLTLVEWMQAVRELIDGGRVVRLDELRTATPDQLDEWSRGLLDQKVACEALLEAVQQVRKDVLTELKRRAAWSGDGG